MENLNDVTDVLLPMIELLHGDCLDRLRELPDCSVDACVTDPPYGLRFMGKAWDYDVPQAEVWREVLRVLKPGGHLLAFAGTRTQHRMAVQIEDAGFEIRDMIAWVYGSGFPKSLDVSKAIDKAAGVEREVVGVAGKSGSKRSSMAGDFAGGEYMTTAPAPATLAAQQWSGWGTALKPSLEPITVARKPLGGTVAENVLRHGTGAINVDGCRVKAEQGDEPLRWAHGRGNGFHGTEDRGPCEALTSPGRWPANLIHDGSDEVVELFPTQTSGSRTAGVRMGMGFHGASGDGGPAIQGSSGSAARFFYCTKASKADRNSGLNGIVEVTIEPLTSAGEPWAKEGQQVRLLVDTAVSPPRVTAVFGAQTKNASEWSTLLFGSDASAQFRMASMSTTGTATGSTTQSKILSCFQNLTTSENTPAVSCDQTAGGSPAASAANGTTSITTTAESMASVLGAGLAASAAQWRISVAAWQSTHPTVKPTELMRYLVRLVTPPGGVVLDPFMGSGSTGKAAVLEGFQFIGIEREAEYLEIARGRIESTKPPRN